MENKLEKENTKLKSIVIFLNEVVQQMMPIAESNANGDEQSKRSNLAK